MPTDGVWLSPSGNKVFIPLENNPEVFTGLVHDLGVSPELGFYDVYSLDEPALLAMVPRPVHSLIFITPAPMYTAVRKEDGREWWAAEREAQGDFKLTYDKSGEDEPVTWFLQTIGNTCGLIALLHSVANGEAKKYIQEGSLLDRLIKEGLPLKPRDRADVLYNSEELEKVFMKSARKGDTSAPQADEACGYHFLAFTKGKDGHLWELEGCCDGPIDRGALPEDADLLSDEALDKGVRRFLNHANGNLEFSIVALATRGEE
ncbi:ubiquitin hydrolase L3 [Emericellopsis atlantica]|uniref:Ubiquitin carboxyl-terminal hydrolase n=1 Tax=Emericellopsis atlantica TaxID=2614577 RepID=A0A9P8CQU9_9HYPO|nr:ubiquitin hydrolase L3 [Emericellopsis atlantica]KAG9256319.1 ubiquitin hydrolase L3 [Emericellopsis atlantica]